MITFETEQDFENAVIDIIKKRLRVSTGYSCGERTIELNIYRWGYPDEEESTPSDCGFAETDLPTPSVRY